VDELEDVLTEDLVHFFNLQAEDGSPHQVIVATTQHPPFDPPSCVALQCPPIVHGGPTVVTVIFELNRHLC
jgi:hypothetical protein